MTYIPPDDATGTQLRQKTAHSSGLVASSSSRVLLWLLFWFAIALIIRLTNLTAKAAWMDEVATTLFSLGNYSRLIPLNEIISLDQILRPLQVTPGATANDVVQHLLAEDNHPPTYFILAHWWMSLFPTSDGYASLWAERALPAIFGALSVPAIYLLAWFSFRDHTATGQNAANAKEARLIGLLCAALMAVSPFSVFLSQEARHYTLAILAVIASLCCFVLAAKAIARSKPLPWGIVLTWIAINVIGLTIHFFCGLTLIAEGLTLLVILIQQCRSKGSAWRLSPWIRIYSAAAGTLAGALLWLPILTNFYGSPQTSFLRAGGKSWQYWVNPIVQSLASWLYVVLSPVTKGYSWQAVIVIVVSCVVLLLYAIWLVGILQRSVRQQIKKSSLRTGIQAMGGFFIMANTLFLAICYTLGFDITRGHRYSFVFFPSVLILVGVSLAPFWLNRRVDLKTKIPKKSAATAEFSQVKLPLIKSYISGRTFVLVVLAVSFMGAQFIVNDLSSLKFYKADRLVNLIQASSTLPVVIGTEATITEQPSVIGIEIMSVAWEIQRNFNPAEPDQRWQRPPQFLIAENNLIKGIKATDQLKQSIEEVPRPFDLWLLNISPSLKDKRCIMPTGGGSNKGSFSYTHYVCDRKS
ncbi:MAG: hypothetical protein WA885_08270 [Phormidesmis sp.]